MQPRRSFSEMWKAHGIFGVWTLPWAKDVLWRRRIDEPLPPAPTRDTTNGPIPDELPWELRNEVD